MTNELLCEKFKYGHDVFVVDSTIDKVVRATIKGLGPQKSKVYLWSSSEEVEYDNNEIHEHPKSALSRLL